MIVAIPPEGASVAVEEVTLHPHSIAKPVRDRQQQQDAADLLVSPRCPVCRAPLVARMTCEGPQFLCLCDETRLRGAGLVKPPQM